MIINTCERSSYYKRKILQTRNFKDILICVTNTRKCTYIISYNEVKVRNEIVFYVDILQLFALIDADSDVYYIHYIIYLFHTLQITQGVHQILCFLKIVRYCILDSGLSVYALLASCCSVSAVFVCRTARWQIWQILKIKLNV